MKNHITIFLYILILINIFSINVSYNQNKNENLIKTDTKIIEIIANDTNTFYTIKLEEKIYEDQILKISRGPVREIKIDDDLIKIITYTPVEIETEENYLIVKGTKKLNFTNISFKEILLEDAIKLFLEKTKYKWLNSEVIPQKTISLELNEIYFENFLRILEEIYGLKTIFYTDKNLIITQKEDIFQNYLPIEFQKLKKEKALNTERKEETIKSKKIIIIESNKDLTILNKIFDIDIINYEEIFVIQISESDEKNFLEIVQKINQKPLKDEENITNITKQASTNIKSDENYTILKSKFDMMFLEDFYNLKYQELNEGYYLIFSDEETIKQVEELNILLNSREIKKEITEEKVLKTNLLVVNSKNIEIFGKICNEENINYKIIEKIENKNYIIVKALQEKLDLLKTIVVEEKIENEISIKKLITELASFENINTIIDFEDFSVNFNNYDLIFSDILSFLSSEGILYTKINENTYRFFENKKILKYKITVLAGDNIENKSINNIYEILDKNVDIFNNIKDSSDNTYIVTKPEMYVLEGEIGELNSVLTIPIFEEKEGKAQVVDTIESGIKLSIKGNYNRDTDLIETDLELLLSEFSDESKREESGYSMNKRSLKTKLKIRNGSTIKAGNMNFSKIIQKSDGLRILKNIPIFGKLFYNSESKFRNYNIIIFLNIEIKNEAEDISI
ncbi:MAG: hypothetical protein ACQESN_05325 [Thermotogota bacterium]